MSTDLIGQRVRLRRTVVGIVIGAGGVLLLWALPGTIRLAAHAPAAFWAMAIAALLVDVPLFGVSRPEDIRVRTTLSVCFTFAIFVVWGLAPAVVVQAVAGGVTVIGQRYPVTSGLYLVFRLICAAFVANLLVNFVDPRPINTLGSGLNGGDLLSFVALGAVWFVVSYGLLVVARATVRPHGVRQATTEIRADLVTTAIAVLVVSPLLTTFTGWWALLIAVPLLIFNRLSREQLQREAQLGREPVSGLLNRQGLDVGMRSITAMDLIEPEARPFGIVVLSADALLAINRTFGRDMYESVVAAISARLVGEYGEDRVARLSGEGMVILMPDLTDAEATEQAEAAVKVLGERVEVDGVPFSLDPIAGVSLSPKHGRDLGTLLTKAELAVSEAARQGRRSMVYVRQAEEVTRRRIDMLQELRGALREPSRAAELAVLYQPQVNVATGQLTGVEALLRWTHPTWGAIPTDELIEAVEPTEVMHMLTRHMLEAVVAQLQRWNELGIRMRAAVNVSVQDLHEPAFVDELATMIRNRGVDPSQLTIEITERTLITDTQRVAQVAATLNRLGVGLSLDDFGTGYASLQQLRLLPLSEVKIDRSYIRGIVDNPADLAIVTSVHELAQALRVSVVAEGVEDPRTARMLARFRGTIGQGYLFGRPMTADALRDWRYSPEPPPRRRTPSDPG